MTVPQHWQIAKAGVAYSGCWHATLKVYGVDGLRVADASIMPRVTTGNTQAPCAIIGEQAAQMIKHAHGLSADAGPWPQSVDAP